MNIFTKKKRNNTDVTQEPVKFIKRPRICCLDLSNKTVDKLKKDGNNIFQGTLGEKIQVPNLMEGQRHKLLLNFSFPRNLHEYDIFILDLDNSKTIDYEKNENVRNNISGSSYNSLISRYPETLFDPRPFSSFLLKIKLNSIINRKYLLIIFSTERYDINYEEINVPSNQIKKSFNNKFNIYSLIDNVSLGKPMYGKEMKTLSKNINTGLKALLDKHIIGAEYNQTFNHPGSWQGYEWVKDENYFPLIVNQNEDIISFYNHSNKFNLFVFPQLKNKSEFLSKFLKEIAPSFSPELFPYSTKYLWKEKKEYMLPNMEELETEKNNVDKEYKNKIKTIDKNVIINKEKFSFLHEILTETGDALVNSLITYLKWLGFTNIRNMDNENYGVRIKEEDLQIDLNPGLLIIEIKGLGGTSTDSKCSQISKIKLRRYKKRNTFDVFALYIVNHQRFLPPLKRKNPPFTDNQISDAENDKRGLLTTWELFNLYFNIKNGIINEKDARDRFIDFGLVQFTPNNLILIDEPKKISKSEYVCIVNIDSIKLKVGEDLIVEKNGRYLRSTIKDMMINDKHINEASSGEIGLKLSKPIEKKSKLWKNK